MVRLFVMLLTMTIGVLSLLPSKTAFSRGTFATFADWCGQRVLMPAATHIVN
ncbi:MAG: hypothetical protein ACFBSF_12000 [Leptolyngbyaceae cyanobacterium]